MILQGLWFLFGRPGLLAVFVFVGAGLVPGVVVFGAVVLPAAGVAAGVAAPLVVAEGVAEGWVAPVPEAGVAGAAGKEVSGVGSGGNGFDRTAAIMSVKPASDWLWRYLYQVVNPSIHSVLPA